MPDYSLVIPCYNEAANLLNVVREHMRALEGLDYEIIVVDNGSTDDTHALVLNSARIKRVRLEQNQGYGGGIIEGLRVASGSVVGYTCGDGQISAETTLRVLMLAQMYQRCAKAVRITRYDPPLRLFQSRVYNWIFARVLGLYVRDINAMPKAWPRRLMMPESRDWFIDVELMIKIHAQGIHVMEVETEARPRLSGRSSTRWFTGFGYLWNAITMHFDGRYRRWTR